MSIAAAEIRFCSQPFSIVDFHWCIAAVSAEGSRTKAPVQTFAAHPTFIQLRHHFYSTSALVRSHLAMVTPAVPDFSGALLCFACNADPSEGMPQAGALPTGSDPGPSPDPVPQAEIEDVLNKLVAAYKKELATFTHGKLVEPDLLPGEKGGQVRICCDKDPFSPPPANYSCDCNGAPYVKPPDCAVGAN